MFDVQFKKSALKSLKKIPPKDQERILTSIIALKTDPLPPQSLKITNQSAYRIRQGDYRIIYTIQDEQLIIEIIRIGHRRNIYE